MSEKIYVGVNNVVKNVSKMYVGVNNVAKKVTKAYVGVNGVAQKFFESYTRLNYLESSGTQYIDTEIFPFQTETEIQFSFPTTPPTNVYHYIAGCYGENNNRYYVVGNDNQGRFMTQNRQGNTIPLQSTLDTNIHTFIYNDSNNAVIFDNVNKGYVSDLTTQITNSIKLFCRDDLTSPPPSCRIYYVKITDKSTNKLIGDFVPAKRDSDDTLGMLNLIDNSFLTNVGTGTFLYG